MQHEERARSLEQKLGIAVGTDNRAAVKDADIIFVCVKPQVVENVMQEIRPNVSPKQLIISVAASVPTSQFEQALGKEIPVVRAMPNTPCAVGCGMTALCKGRFAGAKDLEIASALFNVVGRTVVVDEKHMDAVTGLSASGPAYIYIILESLAEAGVKVGLPRDVATLLAAQTTMGAATVVLETGDHPALLEGRRHYSSRLHHRRHHGARRRQATRDIDQGRGEGGAEGKGTGVRLGPGDIRPSKVSGLPAPLILMLFEFAMDRD